MQTSDKTIWQILWDYDPNALVVVDGQLVIKLANASFCEMFRLPLDQLVGRNVGDFLDDADEFHRVWVTDEIIRGQEKHYPSYGLYVRKVMFAVKDQGLIACIMVDMTHEWQQKEELRRVKQQTLQNVDAVVDKQMKAAQEIAGLLGETTAETKVQMLKLKEMLKKEEL